MPRETLSVPTGAETLFVPTGAETLYVPDGQETLYVGLPTDGLTIADLAGYTVAQLLFTLKQMDDLF